MDLFSSVAEQESNPVQKASAMLLERRLKPPAVIMQSHGPEITAPRMKETMAEKVSEPDNGNRIHSLIETSTEKELISGQITGTSPGNKFTAEILSLPEAAPALPVKEISEITLTSAADPISEPIAIIAVKPLDDTRPKTARGRKSIKEMSMEADLPQVPEDEILFSKQYYGIGEVAIMFHVNASLLRYWETEFDVLKPKKNGKGDRFFRPEDIKNLQIIHHLLRQKKFTIQGAKDYLKNNKQSKEKFEMVKQLQQLKAFLLEMKAGL